MRSPRNGSSRLAAGSLRWQLRWIAAILGLGTALCGFAGPARFETIWDVALPDSVFDPKALIHLDHGYLIAGDVIRSGAHAIRTDDSGRVLWHYNLPLSRDPEDSKYGLGPHFEDAAALPDGNTMLCGSAPDHRNHKTALLVRLDAGGHEVDTQRLSAPLEERDAYGRLMRCITDSTRVIVAGVATSRVPGPEPEADHTYVWLLSLGAQGAIQWQKLVKVDVTNLNQLSRPEILSNGDIVVAGWRGGERKVTVVVHVDSRGELRDQTELEGFYALERRSTALDPIHLVSDISAPAAHKHLVTLDDRLRITEQRTVDLIGYRSAATYGLPDGSALLFGGYEYRMPGPLVVKVSAGGKIEAQYRLNPAPAAGVHEESIDDAVFIGVPGMFATLRRVIARNSPASNHGTVALHLTLVRVEG